MKILVALSGGVDSSITAKKLQDAGHEVVGAYMKLHKNEAYHEKNIAKVRKVGEFLGIKTHILDLQGEFEKSVFMPFIEAYKNGKTPNPCALCNRHIKLGKLLEFAKSIGCEKLATGHYARLENGLIKVALDLSKDQSYFLANVDPDALKSMIFPLGESLKSDIKNEARNYPQLSEIAGAKESSEICFVENSYIDILKDFMQTDLPGRVLNSNGEI
ncbi:MAG: argininosuccinate synthase, partial [Campylobacter sp.]|nr:argininosuccinate synthase [Campylobacter sp.]